MYEAIKDFYDNQNKKLNMAKFSSPWFYFILIYTIHILNILLI